MGSDRVALQLVSPEPEPLALFGHRAPAAVAALEPYSPPPARS